MSTSMSPCVCPSGTVCPVSDWGPLCAAARQGVAPRRTRSRGEHLTVPPCEAPSQGQGSSAGLCAVTASSASRARWSLGLRWLVAVGLVEHRPTNPPGRPPAPPGAPRGQEVHELISFVFCYGHHVDCRAPRFSLWLHWQEPSLLPNCPRCFPLFSLM